MYTQSCLQLKIPNQSIKSISTNKPRGGLTRAPNSGLTWRYPPCHCSLSFLSNSAPPPPSIHIQHAQRDYGGWLADWLATHCMGGAILPSTILVRFQRIKPFVDCTNLFGIQECFISGNDCVDDILQLSELKLNY